MAGCQDRQTQAALRRAARMAEEGVLTGPGELDAEAEAAATLTTTAADLRRKERFDAISGRR